MLYRGWRRTSWEGAVAAGPAAGVTERRFTHLVASEGASVRALGSEVVLDESTRVQGVWAVPVGREGNHRPVPALDHQFSGLAGRAASPAFVS